jgi:phosphate acetyltransferase
LSTNVLEQLKLKAKAKPQRIVLPESGEEKILQAAYILWKDGIAVPILVGKPETVKTFALSINISLNGITIIDHTDMAKVDNFVLEFGKVNADLPSSAIKRMLRDPLNFSAMMLRLGEADCMVAGLSYTTGQVILASQMIVGLKEGISTVSSMAIASIPGFQGAEGELIGLADCAVCAAPTPNELADIAITTSETVYSLMGWEPRIALLSFSTKGSASHEKVDNVLQALEIVHQRRPDILIDGELQLDSAIIPEVAARKIKGNSPVAGKANILIFPDLNAGNIGVKLIQRFARGVAYGPSLQGFAKPVSDLSRGAPVEEIVGAAVLVAVRAQTN